MATLVIGAVGAAIGGAIGGSFSGLGLAAVGGGTLAASLGATIGQTIGGLAGAYVDQLAINALFPQISKGPRASSFPDIQVGDGSPVNYPIGPRVRVPLTLMWAGPIKETRRRRSTGGKGGGGGKQTTYHYFRDCAYHIAGRRILRVEKLIAEGNTIYESDGSDQDKGGFLLAAEESLGRISLTWFNVDLGHEESPLLRPKGRITSQTQNGGPDLTVFRHAGVLAIVGFTNAENNANAIIEEIGRNADGSTYLVLDHGSDGWVTESPPSGQTIQLSQASLGFQPGLAIGVSLKLGDQTAPEPVIESHEGSGNVPTWFGDSYVTFQDLSLDRFGRRAPFIEAIVAASNSNTLELAMDEILRLGGLSPGQFDVSALGGIAFEGYNVQGVAQPSGAVAQLMQFYDVAARWSNDVLTFFPAKDRPSIDLRVEDLGASIGEEAGDGSPRELETSDQADITIPGSVTMSYLDSTIDLAKGAEPYYRPGAPFEGAQEVSIPVVATAAQARDAARRILWDGENSRQVFRVTLPANGVGLAVEENDRVRVVSRGREYEFIAAKVSRDEPGVIELLGPRTPARIVGTDLLDAYLYPPGPSAEDPQGDLPDPIPAPPVLRLAVIDARPLIDGHAFRAGVYFGACVSDASAPFLTGALYASEDGGTSFEELAPIDGEAIMGLTTEAFTNATATLRAIDGTESVNVRLFRDAHQLESVTTAQVQAGRNWAWVGGEIIAFTTATLETDGSYTISGIIRGLRGTEADGKMRLHPANSLFCLLDADGVGFAPLPIRLVGEDLLFRAVSAGGLVSEAVDFPLTFQANTLRPMPLANYLVARDGADVISVSWDRQTRAVSDPLAVVEDPVLQPPERYRITFDDGVTVVEKSVTDARSFVYGTTAQTADGFTPGDPIDVTTREVGVVGDGPESEVALP